MYYKLYNMNRHILKKTFYSATISFLILILISNIYYRIKPYDYREYLKKNNQVEVISYDQTLKNIKDNFNEEVTLQFLKYSNSAYYNSVDHNFYDNLNSISILDNWILYFAKYADPILVKFNLQKKNTNALLNFESFKYHRALGRGFGLCSQNALGLSDLLYKKYNVKIKVVGLDGHIVAEVEIDNKKVILDPSYNIFMPFSIKEAELNLDVVKEYYKYTDEPEIFKTYNSSGNIFAESYGSSNYSPNIKRTFMLRYFEIISDVLSIILIAATLAIITVKVIHSKNGK